MRVDVGVACNKNQDNKWWPALMQEMVDVVKRAKGIELGNLWPVGSALTDYNRNKIVELFEEAEPVADALWFIDDDTKPQAKTLEKLVAMVKAGVGEIVAGIYYSRSTPYNPVCYKRLPNMSYVALANFQVGEIVPVDSTGMGCTLIKREVFEEIRRQYKVYRRLVTGTVFPVHVEDVQEGAVPAPLHDVAGKVVQGPGRGYYVEPVVGPVEDYNRWPFFTFEYGRTEDHPFCEMARRCGFRVVVDTALECGHVGTKEWTGRDFRENMDALQTWKRLKHELHG